MTKSYLIVFDQIIEHYINMKRLSFIVLLVVGLFAFVQAEPIRILGIGNSFTVDALEQHFQPILTAENKEAIVGYPYRGGTWLSQHDAWSNRTDTMPYNYREFRDGKFSSTGTGSYNMTMAMQKEPWDYVIIQSDHDSAGIVQSYEPYLTNLIAFVHKYCSNPNVKIGFYMTWAYDSVSTYTSFKLYKNNTQTMYDSIINAAQRIMTTHPELFLIPCGTAIQNARTSYIGQRMNRDGYHLNYNYGRYIASLCWYRAIFCTDSLQCAYQPESISDYCANMCRAAVNAAYKQPYAITSLAKDFGVNEDEAIPADESHLRRVTFNGMNIPIQDNVFEYTVPVDAAKAKVDMYSFPLSKKAEQNITDAKGADIERDATNYGYFPLVTPELGNTITYTNKVIAEDLTHTTTYTFHLVGTAAEDLVYTIGSKEDIEDFANAVNSGNYGLNAELTNSFSMDHTKQDCWLTPIGTFDNPYTGTFDGKGYTISGFNIYSVDNATLYALKAVGLFGAIANATIKNLTLTGTEESYFNKPSTGLTNNNVYCGILCGYMKNSTISHCEVSCPIFTNLPKGCAVGYLCGYECSVGEASSIDRCATSGTWRIRRNGQYGGLVGYCYNINITNSYSLVKLQLQADFAAVAGGLVAYAKSSSDSRAITLQNCYFAGKVSDVRAANGAKTTATPSLGAIAAAFNGTKVTLNNCYYLENSAPAVLAQHQNYETEQMAESFTNANLTDNTLTAKLGNAFVQGEDHPIIGSDKPTDNIEVMQDTPSNSKYIKDGKLVIVRNNNYYSILGQKL